MFDDRILSPFPPNPIIFTSMFLFCLSWKRHITKNSGEREGRNENRNVYNERAFGNWWPHSSPLLFPRLPPRGRIYLSAQWKKKQREDNSKGFCLPKVNKRLVYLCCQINKSRYIKFISTSMYCIERDRHCITKHSRKLVRNSFFLCVRKFCTSKKGKATDFLRRFRICTTKNTFVENRE